MNDTQSAYTKKSPFNVPDTYFEMLEKQVMLKIDELESKKAQETSRHSMAKTRHRPFIRHILPLTEMAAAVALVSLLTYQAIRDTDTWNSNDLLETKLTKEFSDKGTDAAYEYLMLDNETIYDYVTEDY